MDLPLEKYTYSSFLWAPCIPNLSGSSHVLRSGGEDLKTAQLTLRNG